MSLITLHSHLCSALLLLLFSFFFNHPATTEIYTLSLHDALPISHRDHGKADLLRARQRRGHGGHSRLDVRSEEHTSELQSPMYLVCRLLLEKKKKTTSNTSNNIISITMSRITNSKRQSQCTDTVS